MIKIRWLSDGFLRSDSFDIERCHSAIFRAVHAVFHSLREGDSTKLADFRFYFGEVDSIISPKIPTAFIQFSQVYAQGFSCFPFIRVHHSPTDTFSKSECKSALFGLDDEVRSYHLQDTHSPFASPSKTPLRLVTRISLVGLMNGPSPDILERMKNTQVGVTY